MTDTRNPTLHLQRLLTPASGRDLDDLIKEIIGGSEVENVTDTLTPEAPLFVQAAETRASARRLTVERLLDDYSARLRDSKYPTLDCLLPEDVQRLADGDSLSVDQQHLTTCEPCRNLVTAAQPSDERRRALMRELKLTDTKTR